ncbi:alpha-aminoadipic semialdehyde synthase [Phtheirospermum japonicum]|uniref:Alpha-aminoadipic semialdehyde synthase n=1 Tax=Phtheirospermum japonicum TaxID=374723 RepID=A0A830CH93_9LAMI|nr:alpha-aminoadipic semialdehyde synthase [Phtheirospermum japonicum]
MLGNGVVGILSESTNKWERRVPLTPAHCARLLHSGSGKTGVARIIVQPSTKRIHHDALYEDVGCEISEDLSECGFILGIKQPQLEMILPERAYAFFSHTHKAQKENMPLLDKVLAERATLYDYELIAGDHGKRLLAFGKFAGIAGMIDFLCGLGKRFLNLGYSTPFLSLGASYMYSSLAAAKAAVISVGEEIASMGLPSRICPLVFVFTGAGNVSHGAREIFKLLPHTFVDSSKLPDLFETKDHTQVGRTSKRIFQVYGCVVTCEDMVEHKDPTKLFDKAEYYAHPENYRPVFHKKIAPFTSLQDLIKKGCPLVGISDITCDVGGSVEFVNQTTSIDSPFIRYDPNDNSYHHDMEGDGIICSAVDILPTEFAREASQHFGDILSQFIGSLASSKCLDKLPAHLKRACIVYNGALTSLFEYIPRMRKSNIEDSSQSLQTLQSTKMKYTKLISLSGHLFDQFLINEALDIIEAAGGSFHLVKCQVGQSTDATSYSELEIGADDKAVLDKIIDSLTSLANSSDGRVDSKQNRISLKVGKFEEADIEKENEINNRAVVLILGAGRVCRPAAELLTSIDRCCSEKYSNEKSVHVIVASLYLKDAEEIIEGIPNATAVQLDIMNKEKLYDCISQFKKHLVTASYVDDSMSKLDEFAKSSNVTILCEMGLDPGIDHMMAMKMINQAHARGGKIKSFTSYCGGLPSPDAANNPLAYKFSWSPAGAIRAGRNPAMYKYNGENVYVDGDKLYDSALRLRLPDFPAFALECLPNRNSLVYGELYGIENEASTIFRFGEIMGTLARIGFFNTEETSILKNETRPTYRTFLSTLLGCHFEDLAEPIIGEKRIADRIVALGVSKERGAVNTAKTIVFLGLHEKAEIPTQCRCAFDVTCLRMEERLAYTGVEKDMVLLHHEVEVEFSDGQPTEKHRATLLEFGRSEGVRSYTAMALTVGIPAAIGALLLLGNNAKAKGVIRPLDPEIYEPALEIIEAYGLKLLEKID